MFAKSSSKIFKGKSQRKKGEYGRMGVGRRRAEGGEEGGGRLGKRERGLRRSRGRSRGEGGEESQRRKESHLSNGTLDARLWKHNIIPSRILEKTGFSKTLFSKARERTREKKKRTERERQRNTAKFKEMTTYKCLCPLNR